MKKGCLIGALLLALLPAGAQAGGADEGPDLIDYDHPRLLELLDKINSVDAYEVPPLEIRKDDNYAQTPVDVEPFGGVRPYFEHFLEQMEYTGPGRAIPEPEHLESVKVGFIGPIMATVSVATGGRSHEESLGIAMLQGSRLAVEHANARGGHLKRKLPFELVVSNDNGLWGASGNEIIKMAYKDGVWGILGTIDGANSHIAIRVALKAEVVMINTADTDPTFIETNIPWVVRNISDDRQQAYILIDYLYRKLGYQRVGVIRSSNRYGRFGVREVLDGSRRLKRPVPIEMAYDLGLSDFSLHLERIREAGVEALVHWGDAMEGGRILRQMRESGMDLPFFASDRSLLEEFLEEAGAHAEGVICASPWDPSREDPRLLRFRAAYGKRFGMEPETYAAHAYDGMNMLLWAIQVAGLNRAKIRDVLAYLPEPWPGVTGDIQLSAALDDVGDVYLAKRENGKWNYYSRQDLGIPKGGAPPRDEGAPFHRAGPAEYVGPGRGKAAPNDLGEVRLGYFGPSDPADPEAGDAWLAARWAIEKANAEGGYQGLPFRLVPAWSKDPWGSGVTRLACSIYSEGIWGVVGGMDGSSTHLAEQVVTKARLVLICPGSTDESVNLTNVPWMLSCLPPDSRQAEAIGHALLETVDNGPYVIISANDHDSHMAAVQLRSFLARQRIAPRLDLEFHSGVADFSAVAGEALGAEPKAVVLMAGASDAARLTRALRRGFAGPILGGATFGRRRFLEEAGDAAEGVLLPLLYEPSEVWEGFVASFSARFGRTPDYLAGQTYDAVRVLVRAVREGGLNRPGILDALRTLGPWRGVNGVIEWDPQGRNVRPVGMARVESGRLVALATDGKNGNRRHRSPE